MSKKYDHITDELKEFIAEQKIFFVATARCEGTINLSPKGMDSLRVLSDNKLVWLNLTGSGNETAAHLLENNRMTIMMCAFEGKPNILRLYGHATAYHPRDKEYADYIDLFPKTPGSRQIIVMDIDLVQTSCGFAVPVMEFRQERTILNEWAEKKGEEQIQNYWKEKNTISLDGFETRILE